MSKISVTTIAGLTSGGDANKVKIESGDDLQVVSGDLTVNTDTLFVDASADTVGIGTASPTSALHVSGGAGTNVAIQSSAGTHWRIGDGVGSTNGNLVIYDYTDSRKVFEIDTLGRVTAPNQPSFMARNHGQVANNAAYVQATPLVCKTIDHNVGSHYDSSNGRFTAPVAGRYMFGFSFGICRTDNNETMHPYFVKNSTQIHYQYWAPSGLTNLHGPISFSACINLAASDYLSVTVGGTGDWYAGLQETMMWGYLIG